MSELMAPRKRHKNIRETASKKRVVVDEDEITLREGQKNVDVEESRSQEVADHGESTASVDATHFCDDFLPVTCIACWEHITRENLCVQLTQFYSPQDAATLLCLCEQQLVYNEGDLATVKLFGKRIQIPRKQVAHGDSGLTYTFSGNTIPARPWTPLLRKIRDQVSAATGYHFNFVLINRYKDGNDYMGEHKDDEKDLSPGHPIASLSLGQPRDFVFRHQDSRGKNSARKMASVSLTLEHGVLLLMKHPTNLYWYHSLPRRSRAVGVRVNVTFRQMQLSHCKPA